ncbi:putative glycine-rich RNA-binding protein [Iris pallida]|uniref:Glycine-rich RNA-binding protein n=1 Tax=Iris pallida TaxID=29817 RepID=A0AAX6I2I3_IRIPA|nr:putative glycine-rich RNA-binding protein [Iris pallida]
MAFANKIGGLLKKATTINSSLFQSIRCMSSSKLFIGGLSYGTDDQSLKEAFTNYGEVIEARVIMDRETGRSRGFGFVTFTSSEEASTAITGMDGKDLHGRMVRVNYATDRNRGFGGGGGYGGGGGGYGGGGGGYGGGGGNYGGGGYGGGNYGGGGGGNYGGGNYGGGGGGNYGGGNYGDSYSSGGGGYGGRGGGDGNYNVPVGGSGDSYASADAGSNVASGGGYGSSVGTDTYGSSSTGGNVGYGDTQDDVLGDFKNDDYEPDDYANKRS